jgi:hypothetical protein
MSSNSFFVTVVGSTATFNAEEGREVVKLVEGEKAMAAEAAMEKPRATVEGAMVNDAFYDNQFTLLSRVMPTKLEKGDEIVDSIDSMVDTFSVLNFSVTFVVCILVPELA